MTYISKPSRVSTAIHFGLLILKINLIYISRFFRHFFGIQTITDKQHETSLHNKIIHAKDISEIAAANGYVIREHVVTTKDKYLLVVHKLEKQDQPYTGHGKIAYFHHGLLTNSELFILGSEHNKNLPFLLVDKGWEVWLGNNRGNKYSRKHLKLSPFDPKFWNFSLDEFAYFDIPDTLEYIRNVYNAYDKITYIGFSQGCSQLFASLSLKPQLNSYLNHFVALSPAIVPQNLKHPIFQVIVKQTAKDNSFLYSFLGNRAIMSSVSFWCSVMGPHLYEKVVDKSLVYLFGWTGNNISKLQKQLGYGHMFSNSSVKSLVHWFQIIHAQRFQMFDESCKVGLTRLSTFTNHLKSKAHSVAPFPIGHHLDVPILLVYGDSDILVDMETTKSLILTQNPKMATNLTEVHCPGYEHMDVLWGDDVYSKVFSKVIAVIDKNPPKYIS